MTRPNPTRCLIGQPTNWPPVPYYHRPTQTQPGAAIRRVSFGRCSENPLTVSQEYTHV